MPKSNSIYHHTVVDGREQAWPVDRRAVAGVMPWIARTPEVFEQDLTGMADYFPHWVLVGSTKDKPLRCQRCSTFRVPTKGAIRCPRCNRKKRASGLLWLGHIPVLARPEPAFVRRQQALRAAGFTGVSVGQARYLLVPLTVLYPGEWPNVEPAIHYARRWLKALGLPDGSATHHLLPKGRACIFASGQWQATPIHAVLQQRMVNHITSLFKIAAGQRPGEAFIGRIHHQAWQPEQ